MQVVGVTRDDLFSFQYWRRARESATLGSGNLDEFSMFVTLNDPTSLSNRRVMFQQASGQASQEFEMIDRAVEAFAKVGRKHGVIRG